jgi:hypothetical protein
MTRQATTEFFLVQIGEFVQDFVEVRRAYDEWAPTGTGTSIEKNTGANGLHHHITVAGDRHGLPDTDVHSPHIHVQERPSSGNEKV